MNGIYDLNVPPLPPAGLSMAKTSQVQDIAQKYQHRADLELVYPKSYWNKNRVKAAEEGETGGAADQQRLFVDVKAGVQ